MLFRSVSQSRYGELKEVEIKEVVEVLVGLILDDVDVNGEVKYLFGEFDFGFICDLICFML